LALNEAGKHDSSGYLTEQALKNNFSSVKKMKLTVDTEKASAIVLLLALYQSGLMICNGQFLSPSSFEAFETQVVMDNYNYYNNYIADSFISRYV